MKKISFFIFAISFFSYQNTFAQTGDEELEGDKVDVFETFEAQLEETNKVDLTPQLPPLDTTTKKQNYDIPAKNTTVEYPAPRIRPLAMKQEELANLYSTYFKLGGGIPTSFYGEGAFNKFVEETYDIHVGLKTHSANFSNNEVDNQRFRETNVDLGGTYYFDEGYAINGKMGFTNDEIYFYGYNFDPEFPDTVEVDADNVKQRFNTFDLEGNFFNGVRTAGDINYDAGFKFYGWNDNFSAKESGFILNLDATKWFNNQHSFDLGIKGDWTTFEDTTKQKLNNFHISPAFTYHGGVFSAKLGANAVAFDSDFSFFPNIELSANITGSELGVFVGAEGSLQKNTARSLSDYNPFISIYESLNIRNTKYYHYYGGIRGNIKILEYQAQIGFKSVDNLALFVQDTFDTSIRRRFQTLYDNGNIITVSGSLKAQVLKNLAILGTVGYNIYDLDTQEKAWHLPALEINGSVVYTTLEDKLKLTGSLFIENGVPIDFLNDQTVRLNSLFDLSFAAEYDINQKFGAFLNVNNILDNERERWLFYPTYGFNILVGVTAKF